MKFAIIAVAVASVTLGTVPSVSTAGDVNLPKEVTPKLRAACESDVRRLCVDESPTVAKVKSCVARKFLQLGTRCQYALASAGFNR